MKETRISPLDLSPQHIYKISSTAGTSGRIVLSESIPGGANKTITIVLSGYVNTVAVTIPYPVPFTSTPITARALIPATVSPTILSTSAIIPIAGATTAVNGTIVIIGAGYD